MFTSKQLPLKMDETGQVARLLKPDVPPTKF
jgi:hypothetical protein